jgi:hypothetical protein
LLNACPTAAESDWQGSNEAYCWISPYHAKMRLPLHFIWVLIASFGSLTLYGRQRKDSLEALIIDY